MSQKRFEDVCLTIGELSQRTTVTVETIRYYERIGLLPRPPRTRGGHRSFGIEICRTLAFIKRSRELGFGLEDIRTLLSLRGSHGPCRDVKPIAQRHLESVRAKLLDLKKLEAVLAAAVERCPDDASADCPVLDSLDNECCRIADAVPATSCCSPASPGTA
jgi:MerR family mercuric resistance operon transcriptional regulator